MASIKQLPSCLDITLKKGDDFSFSVTFNIDLSPYTLNATCGDMTFDVTEITGFIYNITITKQQSNNMLTDRTWTLTWTASDGTKRTLIEGTIRTK
jgi:hypothetical protein